MATKKKAPRKENDNTQVAGLANTHIPETPEVAKQISRKESTEKPGASFPIVGIGASAGGLAAFEAFFSGMPTDVDPGMAFILVQHLAPDHKSILTELIRRYTRMQVFEVEDGMIVQPNCTYIIPPGCEMALMDGRLQLLEPVLPRGQRLPIDFFFRSLAQDQQERAIGIVLSGTGSDGTLGVRAIKGEGGMVMAQNLESTEFDGMPRSAIATGLVDYVLTPVEIPAQLMDYLGNLFGKSPRPTTLPTTDDSKNAMKKIFILLRAQIGHDFSGYKAGTINRRIERRMTLNQIEGIDSYVRYLQQTPDEVEALFRDLLIGVTSFFRDPDAFKALEEQIIPKLFAGKDPDATIRVWVPGCSTGEEAYSIAILLAERQEAMKRIFKVQVFATDIDSEAISTARAGLYPSNITSDLSVNRLQRFFVANPDGSNFRIHKGIRDMLVFSEQNIIKDPPFSKIDLVSCRNLMIYLGSGLQKKIIPMFHYALSRKGFLFLGTSESTSEFLHLFRTVENKEKLYQRKEHDNVFMGTTYPDPFVPLMKALATVIPKHTGQAFPEKLPLRELTETALRQYGPTAVLVNKQGNILYLHGRTGMYLEPTPGEAGVANILKMARDGLRQELTTALHKSALNKETIRCPGLRVKTNGDFTGVDMTVQQVKSGSAASLYLVILERAALPEVDTAIISDSEAEPGTASELIIAGLKNELRSKEEYLQTTHEQLETSCEELKSSNEEMQSVNEELQSTNEELETSKEELQSVNEELATVNNELQTKVTDLSQVNDDMHNLLAGTGIATVFVDHSLHILRFTPAVTKIINLISSDLSRPVGHIVSNLVGYDSLVADTQTVLDTLITKELEVQTRKGKWYTLRIQPYRTTRNVIEGAVITFMDITDMVQAKERLHKANELNRLAIVVRDAHDAITVQDLTGRILAWNPGAVRMYGWSEAEALAMHVDTRIPEELQAVALEQIKQLSLSDILKPSSTQRLCKDGTVVTVWLTSTSLIDEAGQMYAIATTERLQQSPTTQSLQGD